MDANELVKKAWKQAVEPQSKLAVSATAIADDVIEQIAAQLDAAADIRTARADVFEITFRNGWLKEDQKFTPIELGEILATSYDEARKADSNKYVPLIFCLLACGSLGARFAEPKEDAKSTEDKLKDAVKQIISLIKE